MVRRIATRLTLFPQGVGVAALLSLAAISAYDENVDGASVLLTLALALPAAYILRCASSVNKREVHTGASESTPFPTLARVKPSYENCYRRLLETMNDGVGIMENSGTIVYANSRLREILGRPLGQLVGFKLQVFVCTDQRAFLEKALEEEDAYRMEARLSRGDGSERYSVISISPLEAADGIHGGYLALITDIDERVRAEMEATNQAILLRSILNSVTDGVVVTDKQDRYLLVNPAAEQMTGLPATDGTAGPIESVDYGAGRSALAEAKASYNSLGDCTEPRVSATWMPLFDANNQVAGEIVTLRDVTEISKAEAELRKNAEMLTQAQRIARLGTWRWDYQLGFCDCSEELGILFGLPNLSHDMDPIIELAHPDDRERVRKLLGEEALQSGRADFDFRMAGSPMRVIHAQATLERNAAGEPLALFGVLQDVTERKQIESELRRHHENLEQLIAKRTAELTALNKELESFSYSVSHDLKAPLRAINGFSQILQEDHLERLDSDGRSCIERIRNATIHMVEMIDGLMKLSNVLRHELRRQPVDLSHLAAELARELVAANPERQVDFEITDGITATADRALMRVLLENLLGNAWKFTAKREAAKIAFGNEVRGERTIYYVKDNGAGFDPHNADCLFSPFQRLHSEKEYEGTGIGLASVARIIQRHGGNTWAEGEPDKGATFYFTLGERYDAFQKDLFDA